MNKLWTTILLLFVAGIIALSVFCVIKARQLSNKPKNTQTVQQQKEQKPEEKISYKIYLVALEDNGESGIKFGCNDSAVSVTRETKATKEVLKAAITDLLSLKDQYYGQSGLHNALYDSNLAVDSINLKDGLATIKLKGELKLAGVCQGPRIKAQLEETAKQFSTVKQVKIYINDKDLNSILSLKGE